MPSFNDSDASEKVFALMNRPKFAAYRSTTQSTTGSGFNRLVCDNVLIDTTNGYDNTTGIYTHDGTEWGDQYMTIIGGFKNVSALNSTGEGGFTLNGTRIGQVHTNDVAGYAALTFMRTGILVTNGDTLDAFFSEAGTRDKEGSLTTFNTFFCGWFE